MTCETCQRIENIARFFMASMGMPSLVINAPEDDDDEWRVYPGDGPMVGKGPTLAAAIEDALTHPQLDGCTGAKP